MSGLTEEQFNQLPEFVKSDYEKTDNGYVHGGVLKLKGSLNDLDSKYKSTEARLSEFEKTQRDAILKAQQEAYEKAKKEGNVEEIEKRYQEQLADAQKRAGETQAQYEERLKALTDAVKSDKVSALVSELAGKHATESGREAFKLILKQMIDYDAENNKTIFKGLDGSATSLDLSGFEKELVANPIFASIIKANPVTNGGGNANGNTGGSAASGKVMSRSFFDVLSPKAKADFFKSGGKIID